jgi:hypothetical protein
MLWIFSAGFFLAVFVLFVAIPFQIVRKLIQVARDSNFSATLTFPNLVWTLIEGGLFGLSGAVTLTLLAWMFLLADNPGAFFYRYQTVASTTALICATVYIFLWLPYRVICWVEKGLEDLFEKFFVYPDVDHPKVARMLEIVRKKEVGGVTLKEQMEFLLLEDWLRTGRTGKTAQKRFRGMRPEST